LSATRTKRILSIQPVAERGGSDRALVGLVRSLAEDGWDCHIAVPAPAPMAPELLAAGATIHIVPMRRITTAGSLRYWLAYLAGWPLAVTRLVRLARRVDARIIHSNSLHSWYGWAAAALLRRPHVWHAREIVIQSRAALKVERLLCRHFAARVVAVSRAVAAQLDGRNVVVVYDGADRPDLLTLGRLAATTSAHQVARPDQSDPFAAGTFRAGAGVGIGDGTPLVGAAGRIDTWKGFDVLLDAVAAMRAARPGLEVVIAGAPVPGKEGYARTLRDRADAMAGVHWLGGREDMPALMADLDVFVLPSTGPEPFGLVLVEALASGVPVVATAAGGPLEILESSPPSVGRLVAPGDPAALAEATIALLPDGPSDVERRRSRSVLSWSTGRRVALPEVFGSLLDR